MACGAWSADSTPNPLNYNFLQGVSALTSTDVWAVGDTYTSTPQQALALHWDGTSWTSVPPQSPSSQYTILLGVETIATDDVWAVGYYYNSNVGQTQPLAEHYDGTSWTVVSVPVQNNQYGILYGVDAVSATDIWGAGQFYNSSTGTYQPLIEHFDGTAWTQVTAASPASYGFLWGIDHITSTDLWAVGYQYGNVPQQTLTEHWDGTTWTAVPAPNPGGTNYTILQGTTALATDDVWATGYYYNGTTGHTATLAEHWDGSSWSQVPTPNPSTYDNYLIGMSAVGPNSIYAVGYQYNPSSSPIQPTLIEHWDGTAWSQVTSENPGANYDILLWVSALPSGDAWTVGYQSSNNGSSYQTLVESTSACSADLGIAVQDSPDPVVADSNETYTLTVTNGGPTAGHNVQVTDTLPTTAAFVSATPTQGSCSQASGTVTCNLGTMNSGGQATVTVVVTPIQPGSIMNSASVSGSDPDPDGSNNSASESTTVSAQANTVYVQVTNSGYTPASISTRPGIAVQWNFLEGTHSATDASGMGLFDSGLHSAMSYYRYTFFASATYDVVDSANPANTSTISEPDVVRPKTGTTTTHFKIQWALQFAPPGYVYDVEIKRPSTPGYVDWLVGVTYRNTDFVPDSGPGQYAFKAHIRNATNGASARFSPPAAITVNPRHREIV